MKFSAKNIITYLPQIFILIICFFLELRLPVISSSARLLLNYSSYVIFVAGIFLSFWFNRSRIFFILLLLSISQFLLNYCNALYIEGSNSFYILYPILCILIPLNVTVFSRFKESGIFSTWGRVKFILIFLEAYSIFMIIEAKNQSIINILNQKLPLLSKFQLPITLLPFISILLILLFYIIMIYLNKNTFDIKMFVMLLSVITSISLIHDRTRLTLFLAAAGFMLILGILEVSYNMAYIDELTGIPSRRALKEDLLKLGMKYSIAMVDIDHFKKFNDTHGHDVGDLVLKMVAGNLAKVAGGGKAYRFGGEEFTILFPGKNLAEVMPYLEDVRESVSKAGFSAKPVLKSARSSSKRASKQLYVTISIGVAEKNPSCKTPNEVLKSADKALYKSKNKGRNCVSK